MLAPNDDINAVLNVKPGGGGRRWFTAKRMVLAVLALVVAAGLWWWIGSGSESRTVYTTAEATRGGLTVTISATGTVEPINQVDIGSELSGIVDTVLVDFNDLVKAGDVLAEIDTDKLAAEVSRTRAQLAAAKANVAQAEATVSETKKDVDRVQPLAAGRYASTHELETAQSAYSRALAALDAAKAQVAVAEADLASDEADLGKAKIRSPINGIVLDRAVDPGQTVAAALSAPILFTIAEDLSEMNLLADVDEADAGSVKEGQEATFTVEAYTDREFPAKVEQLRYAPETVSGVVTYKAVLSVDNAALLLRPGMTATAEIVVDRVTDALLIPNAALRYAPEPESGGGGGNLLSRLFSPPRSAQQPSAAPKAAEGKRQVWKLENGTPVAVEIEAGATDGLSTVVKTGDLKEGDALITDASTAE